MKKIKNLFAAMMLWTAIAAPLAACSDNNDKDEPTIPAAKSVEGVYEGTMTCTVMGSASEFENMTFTLTSTDDATVSLTISSFGEPPMQVPELTIPGIKVAGQNGTYTLASTDFDLEAGGKKCSGVVEGSYANNRLTINYNLQYGAMPMPMICTFTAPKK